jgi:RNA polymerase sigma-70 factor (ECF subfamily)
MLHSIDHQHVGQHNSYATDEPTDEELMGRIQQGDERALEFLHHRHHGLLHKIVSRIIFNDSDADELVQECLLEAWRHAANYDPAKGQALGWLVTLARRRAIDRVRRKSAYWRAQDRFRVEREVESATATQCGADEEAAQGDAASAVAQLIEKLPEAQRQAIRLAFYGGMSQRQIATHTGTPLGTVKTRLELAMRKLKSAALVFGELRDIAALGA